jgi:hypothetical protein
MMTIPVGIIGRLISGNERGRYVKVEDDFENTGGYLVLISSDPEFNSGGDYWVEKKLLAEFLEELGPVIWSVG